MNVERHQPDWNKDRVWNKIEDRLHQKKQRRFLFWWFVGTASAALFIGFWIYLDTMKDANIVLTERLISTIEQDTNPKEVENNIPLEHNITFNENSKEDEKLNREQTKHSSGKEQRLATDEIAAKSTLIQFKEEEKSATNKRNLNMNVDVTPQNRSVETIETAVVINEKMGVLDTLPVLPIALLQIDKREIYWKINGKHLLGLKKEQRKASKLWWLESGMSIGNKSYANLNEESARDLTREQFRFMQTNSMGVQQFLNENWSLKLGFTYQTIYEKYEYLSFSTKEEDIFSEEAIVYELPEAMNYVESGLTTLSTTTTRLLIHNNIIHRLSVPVGLTYTFDKNNWSLEPSLGFRFQFAQHFEGVITQNRDHLFDRKEINNTYYSNNLSMGLTTSLNLKYRIFSNASLGLGLSYEKDDFLNLVQSNLFARYETVGLRLGYYYCF